VLFSVVRLRTDTPAGFTPFPQGLRPALCSGVRLRPDPQGLCPFRRAYAPSAGLTPCAVVWRPFGTPNAGRTDSEITWFTPLSQGSRPFRRAHALRCVLSSACVPISPRYHDRLHAAVPTGAEFNQIRARWKSD